MKIFLEVEVEACSETHSRDDTISHVMRVISDALVNPTTSHKELDIKDSSIVLKGYVTSNLERHERDPR